ncbi:hypothetical protein HanRHA438_Chr13g0626961 [Helianthus annuus]|nr:hypothetical protein HanRHA438_Chr13g0626961 [Helianthus annuus]
MLFGQHTRSILSQNSISNFLRGDKRSLPVLSSSSSFSPKLTNFLHPNTFNSFKFTRTLLASASDSHRYLISSQFCMHSSSTAPKFTMTPLHTSSVTPKIDSIFNLVFDEAARTRLLSTLSPHPSILKTLSEGNASSETSIKLGHLFICSSRRRGNITSLLVDHTFQLDISSNLRISSEGKVTSVLLLNSKLMTLTSSIP